MQVAVIVEDDSLISLGISANSALRSAGMSSELVASGSPKKRFDKGAKLSASAIVVYSMVDGHPDIRMKSIDDELAERIKGVVYDDPD